MKLKLLKLLELIGYKNNVQLYPPRQIFIVQNKEQLKNIIEEEIKLYGNNCDLNHIDVSQIKDMSNLFRHSTY